MSHVKRACYIISYVPRAEELWDMYECERRVWVWETCMNVRDMYECVRHVWVCETCMSVWDMYECERHVKVCETCMCVWDMYVCVRQGFVCETCIDTTHFINNQCEHVLQNRSIILYSSMRVIWQIFATWLIYITVTINVSACRIIAQSCLGFGVLQCVAVCCSVLPCVAVWCSVLQCVAVCCRVLQCIAVYCSIMFSV